MLRNAFSIPNQLAQSGGQLIQDGVFCQYRPDVVFADITMPVMGGHELARRIRERPEMNSTYLVALTGFEQSTDRERVFEAGFDRHLTKPVDIQRLRELFDELDISKSESEVRSDLQTGGFH